MTAVTGRVSRRPVTAEDVPFLLRLYASTRRSELELMPLSEQQKLEFLRFQYDAQSAHHRTAYPDGSFQVVSVGDGLAGRLYVDRTDERIHLIDISLLPEFRGQGIGSSLLEELAREADAAGVPITAHVERHNRALGLYERLGFNAIADREVYLPIERPPSS